MLNIVSCSHRDISHMRNTVAMLGRLFILNGLLLMVMHKYMDIL
jgi:hypothetical protein